MNRALKPNMTLIPCAGHTPFSLFQEGPGEPLVFLMSLIYVTVIS